MEEKRSVLKSGGLVITRKPGDTVVVDGPATIRFLEYRGERARWQIVAPQSTTILRGELLERLSGEKGADDERA